MPPSQRPLSDAQLAANRANAARSTGPATASGKARSAQNARKHGFRATAFSAACLEDLQQVANLRDDLIAVYQPVNSQELFAIERIAICQQGLLRAARLETGLLTDCLIEFTDPVDGQPLRRMSKEMAGDGDAEIARAQNRNYALAEGFRMIGSDSNIFSLYLRYQSQAERQYRSAVADFERLKALRPDLPNEPICAGQPEENKAETSPETNPFPAPQPSAERPSETSPPSETVDILQPGM
ncbi:MAG TPA: hypothetical protein VGH38_22155 [Bryobacteraceae bacterium]